MAVPPSSERIANSCNKAGFTFDKLDPVTTTVYRGTLSSTTLDSSRQVYLKIYPDERLEEVRQFAKIATDAGHPPCRLVVGEQPILVMGVANGQPLSRLFPLLTLPGVWLTRGHKLRHAYQQIGTAVGRLHAATETESGPVLNDEERTETLDRIQLLRDQVSEATLHRIHEVIDHAAELSTPHAITYGDRSPHNIYYHRGSVTLIDSNCINRSVTIDHSSAILGIRLMTGRFRYAGGRIATLLEHAYRDGYVSTGLTASLQPQALAARYIASNLALLDQYASTETTLNKILKFVDRPLIYNEITRILETLPRAYTGE